MQHSSSATNTIEIPKWLLTVLNSVYEVEQKLALHGDPGNASRNIERIKETIRNEGLFYEDPMGQPFKETRTDLDATISGESTEDLFVAEVIKPIIRVSIIRDGQETFARVIQKGIVVVQAKPVQLEGEE